MNTNRQFQCGSDWIGDQHRRLQPDAQIQTVQVFAYAFNKYACRNRFLHHFCSIDAGNNGFGQNRFHLVTAGLTLQETQQSGGIIKHGGHSFASRFAASRCSVINSSARLVASGSQAKRLLRRCLIVPAFSSTRRPSSMRAIKCSPAANLSDRLSGTGITNRPWKSRWTSGWVADFGMALNFVARE
jgi:hypothetical protein